MSSPPDQERGLSQPDEIRLAARLLRLESYVAETAEDEVNLAALGRTLWKHKWWIAATTGLFTVGSLILALWLPNEYTATAILVPATQSPSSSTLAQLAGRFGGLASLAGINLDNLGSAKQDNATLAMKLLKTWGFLDDFIKENHIEVPVLAAKGWNRRTNQLIIDRHLYNPRTKSWVKRFSTPSGKTSKPPSWQLYKAFRDRISVSQDSNTGLISLSVEYYSPFLAKEWVDKLVTAVNKRLQTRDREEATKSINYLQKQVKKTSLTDMRQVFYQLIEEETKNLMLAEVNDEYALKTLSAAKTPEEKSSPHRLLICALGFVLGAVLAVFGVLAFGSGRSAAANQN